MQYDGCFFTKNPSQALSGKTILNTIYVMLKNVMTGLRHITLGYEVGSTPTGRPLKEMKAETAEPCPCLVNRKFGIDVSMFASA